MPRFCRLHQSPAEYIPYNGIIERLHKMMLNEFYRMAFRKKLYLSIGELQDDLDLWIGR